MKVWSGNKREWRHLLDLGVEGRQFHNMSYIIPMNWIHLAQEGTDERGTICAR